jgi:hypothetical protein
MNGRNRAPDAPILEVYWPVLPFADLGFIRDALDATRMGCPPAPEDPERWDTRSGLAMLRRPISEPLQTVCLLPIYHQ